MKQRKPQIPKVVCLRCDGRGTVEISQHLAEVYNIVGKIGKATSPEVYRHQDFKSHTVPTAVNNRLEDLLNLNLLGRFKKDGKTWVYYVL